MTSPPIPPKQRPVLDALQLVGLSAFAVGQPLLDLLGAKPEFFAVRRSEPLDLVLLAFLACSVPALPFVAAEGLVGRLWPRWRPTVHLTFVAFFVLLIVLPPLNRTFGEEASASALIPAALAIGVGAAVACGFFPATRMVLNLFAAGLVIFPLAFALRPGVGKLLTPGGASVTPVASQAPSLPVVMVVFDELPLTSLLQDPWTLDAVRYPHFAELAADATWFRRAATVSDFTIQAVPSILTGRYPAPGLLPIAVDHPDSLLNLLGVPGAANVSESVTHLCPPVVCSQEGGPGFLARQRSLWHDVVVLYLHLVTPADLADGLPPVDQNWMFFADRDDWKSDWDRRVKTDRLAQVDAFFEGFRASEEGSFHFLHVLLPHGPFDHLPSGRRYSFDGHLPGRGGRTTKDPAAAVEGYQRHLLQVGFADLLLGQLVARLKEVGLYDRALLVVTADHGASFLRPGEERRHLTTDNVAEIVPVPLLIKAPGQRAGVVDDRLVETIDILPTVAEHAGVEVPWPVDGHSLVGPRPMRDGITFFRHKAGSRERQVLSSEALDLGDFLHRKADLVGTGADSGGPYQAGPLRRLVGRPAAAWTEETPSSLVPVLDLPTQAFYLEPDPHFVPSHLTGRLEAVGGGPPPGPVRLAAAVNGQLAAATLSRGDGAFSLLVAEEAYRIGHNHLELFELRGEVSEAIRLLPIGTDISSEQTRPANLIFEPNISLLGVRVSGFHNPGTWPDLGPIRWTDGRAKVSIPARLARGATGLRLELASSGPDGTRLRIRVNGRKVFSRKLDKLPEDRLWPIEVDLGETASDGLEVVLESGSFVPKKRNRNSEDERTLGVAVASLELMRGPS